MPEVPRDPRQLARDILSGKIKIEDLARERMRAAGGGLVPPKPPVAAPRMPPAPVRPAPQKPIPPRAVARAPLPQRPIPPSPQRPQARKPLQRPMETPRAVPTRPPGVPPAIPAALQPPVVGPSPITAAKPAARKPLGIRGLLQTRQGLQQGILMAEILGKPLALREE